MRAVWEALNLNIKTWRQVYKGLELLEVLIKSGSERCVDDARDHIFRIRSLTDYSHMENGRDQGAGIREIAKRLVELLNDTERLREERKKSKELSAKLVGISNDGVPSSMGAFQPSYGNNDFSNNNYGNNNNNNEWGRNGRSQDDMHNNSTTRGGGRGSRASSIIDEDDNNDFDRNNSKQAATAQRHQELANAAAARRGRRPAGGATHASTSNNNNDDFDNFGTVASTNTTKKTSDTTFDDFDSFTSAPAPAPSNTAARMNTALPKTTTNTNVPKLSGPSTSTTTVDSFDPFNTAPVRTNPAPAPAPMDDFFGAPISAPAKTTTASNNNNGMLDLFGTNTNTRPIKSNAPVNHSASFDPFAVPAPTPAPTNTGFTQPTNNNPFANMNFGGLQVPTNQQSNNNNDGFGSFTTGPNRDDDVDRLVALDRLSLGDMNKNNSSPSGVRNAPLKTLGQTTTNNTMKPSVMNNNFGSPMNSNTTGINISSISAMSPTLLGGNNNPNTMTGFMPNTNPNMNMMMMNQQPRPMNNMNMMMGNNATGGMNNNPFGNMGMGMTIPPVGQQPRPMNGGGFMMPTNSTTSGNNNLKPDAFSNLNFF